MTRRQKEALDFIRARLEATGIAPSYEEIREALGLKSRSNSHAIINRLMEDGHLVRRPGCARSLRLPVTDLSDVPTANLIAELENRGWKRAA
jgi:repressor LexA